MAFIKQSVKGSIIAIYIFYGDKDKNNILKVYREGSLVFANNAEYLNKSWKSYHENNDEYVCEKINFMMKNESIKHVSCLFKFIWSFLKTILFYVLARIDVDEIQDKDYLSKSIENIMDAILAHYYDNLIEIGEKICGQSVQCEHEEYKSGKYLIKY